MNFNKNLFSKNADSNVKRLLSSHLDVLDGMKVAFKDGDKFGIIEHYEINGEPFYLYPVEKEWCAE
ncbi:hypothetical protein [Oceanobacillus salinisoli]|uniref:hypothetical protein n=1 Tax=Oceanobacillus salinisoli TaxID=2678611 RepID=UPI0012E0CA5D|nr:hypothetical protein [Oceanobacillus salinisoli]